MKNNAEQLLPLVSVLIPSYNHEKYIEDAVRSVWAQTYKNIELIVIDDGSGDDSVNILNALKSISPIAMKIIAKKNEGVCRTLNIGLKMANGKYISILASDDRYISNKFEMLLPIIEKTSENVSFVYSKNLNINEDGSQAFSAVPNFRKSDGNLFEEILTFKIFPALASAVIKKNILLNVGCFNERYKFEDLDLMLRLTRTHQGIFCDIPTFEYRGNVVGSLGKNTKLLYQDTIDIFIENIKFSRKLNNHLWVRYAYSCLYNRLSESFYMSSEFKESRRWALKSIFQKPLQYLAYRLYIPSLLGRDFIEFIRNCKSKNRAIFARLFLCGKL